MNLSITGYLPEEPATHQAFGEQAQAVAVSPQHLYLIALTSTKDEEVDGE